MPRLFTMALLILVTCTINFAVFTILFRGHSAFGVGSAISNGDVNGDSALNIGDPVYLLSYLFSSGPPPVAIAAGPTCASCDFTQAEVDLLKEIAGNHLSIEMLDDGQGGTNKTVRFTGVNLQVVNGLGATNGYPSDPDSIDPLLTQVNGVGNLIVGYAEASPAVGAAPVQTGSHSLVAGLAGTFTSFGGIVSGRRNTTTGPYSSVTGGRNNTASSADSAVGGGQYNHSSGEGSSVTGGAYNTASGVVSSVTGGGGSDVAPSDGNLASGASSSVSGGSHNTASGTASWAGGGSLNTATGLAASTSGGVGNEASQIWSCVSAHFGQSEHPDRPK